MAVVRPIILIPTYNTGPILRHTISSVIDSPVPVWVVVDGSTDGSPEILKEFQTGAYPDFRTLILPENQGKGSAVLHGTKAALEAGYTHVLCMDADGQHPAASIGEYLKKCAQHPEAAVFGRPIFDSSAPAIRVNGRKLSNFWANLETLGWGIDDSLFGMRLYPAQELVDVIESTSFARRFDFDPEVGVRLAWRGVPILNIPTPVRYPSKEEGGISQFRYLRDNVLLTWMHLRLFLGFLVRFPILMKRGSNPLDLYNPPSH